MLDVSREGKKEYSQKTLFRVFFFLQYTHCTSLYMCVLISVLYMYHLQYGLQELRLRFRTRLSIYLYKQYMQ